jgi:uncharacterized membrane protein (UPF0136 family)
MVKIAAFLMGLYGLLSLVGGIIGFTKGSTISLVAGGSAGLILLACAWFARQKPMIALPIGLLIAAGLLYMFGRPLLDSKVAESAYVRNLAMAIGGAVVVASSALALLGGGRSRS